MFRAVALACLCAACGRLDFGEIARVDAYLSDAVTGHDEDGDGLPDVIDPCPHIAGGATDSDGDGVGDACDPDPAAPNETITVFSPLTAQSGNPFDPASTTTAVQDGDGLRFPGDAGPQLPRTLGTVRVDIGFTINALIGTGQHQVACGIEGTTPYYFVELDDNGPTIHDVAVFSYDGTNGYVPLGLVDIPGMHTGRGILRFDANVTRRDFRTTAGWIGELYNTSASTPAYDAGQALRFALNGLDITLEYIILIETR